jgi:hypothetical protein
VGVPPGWTRLAQATGGLLFALLALRLALSKAEAA